MHNQPVVHCSHNGTSSQLEGGVQEQIEVDFGVEKLHLNCHPLATPFQFPGDPEHASVTTIEISGEVAHGRGSGHVILGSSSYAFNEFGDAKEVEARVPRKIAVELVRRCHGPDLSLFEIVSPTMADSPIVYVQCSTAPLESQLLIGEAANEFLGVASMSPARVIPLQNSRGIVRSPVVRQSHTGELEMYSDCFLTKVYGCDQIGSITLRGRLGGPGKLTHDCNSLSYHWSKDAKVSIGRTALGFYPQLVTIEQSHVPDPAMQNRRLFKLVFENESSLGDVSLVMSAKAEVPYRLIIARDGSTQWVLPLHQ